MTNARDVITDLLDSNLLDPDVATHSEYDWLAAELLAALMAAAGVAPGGDLVIHHGDGWPLRRLKKAERYPLVHMVATPHDVPLYRVVTP